MRIRSVFASRSVALLVLLIAACGDNASSSPHDADTDVSAPDGSGDTTESDAPDTSDVTEDSTEADTADAPSDAPPLDSGDTDPDTSEGDAADASDATDAPDATDTSDATDAPDATDALDAAETPEPAIRAACRDAFDSCAPSLAEFAASWCATLEDGDPCATRVVAAYERDGCFTSCEVGIPGLAEVCLADECAALVAGLTTEGGLADECATCACVPDCDGLVCGPDGCGGVCGACGPGSLCDAGQQCVDVPESCRGSTPLGCCYADDEVLACSADAPTLDVCDEGSGCGWDADVGAFGCVPLDASGDAPPWINSTCDEGACVPQPEICDGLSQRCTDVADAEDPAVMCAPLFPDASQLAAENPWACSPPAPGADGCRIRACAEQFFDVNGSRDDGCECAATPRSASMATCSAAAAGFLGEVVRGGTALSPSATIPPIDDGPGGAAEDWYSVSFPIGDGLGSVVVDLSTNDSFDYRFEAYSACGAVPWQGLATAFGAGAPPVRVWRYDPTLPGSINPFEAAGAGSSLGTVYLRVFRVQNNNTCSNYQLRVRRF